MKLTYFSWYSTLPFFRFCSMSTIEQKGDLAATLGANHRTLQRLLRGDGGVTWWTCGGVGFCSTLAISEMAKIWNLQNMSYYWKKDQNTTWEQFVHWMDHTWKLPLRHILMRRFYMCLSWRSLNQAWHMNSFFCWQIVFFYVVFANLDDWLWGWWIQASAAWLLHSSLEITWPKVSLAYMRRFDFGAAWGCNML